MQLGCFLFFFRNHRTYPVLPSMREPQSLNRALPLAQNNSLRAFPVSYGGEVFTPLLRSTF